MAYIHALRFSWLTSLYDPVVRWTTREATFKRRLVAEATVENGQRNLDLGCESGEVFERAVDKIVPPKIPPKSDAEKK